MKKLLIVLTVLSLAGSADAQPGERRERVKAALVAYLTEQVAITPEQAEKFWPSYNEFNDRRRAIVRRKRAMRQGVSVPLTNEAAAKRIDEWLALSRQELELKEDYYRRWQAILTPTQVAALLVAERAFVRELMQRFGERRGGPPDDDLPPDEAY